jgi:hypothetical protein
MDFLLRRRIYLIVGHPITPTARMARDAKKNIHRLHRLRELGA